MEKIMSKDIISINNHEIDVYSLNTVVVGSGAAAFNAADSLYNLGQKNIAIVTEGVNMGTSRNTGSDKQTYYKLTSSGDMPDSVLDMAQTLFSGGAMHGDIALIEAAVSSRCFYKLVNLGVPFPHNTYGEYVGYKTDYDTRQRATSCGPLTSKIMTEKLHEQIRHKGIKIFDGFLVIGILTEKQGENKRSIGLITLDISKLHNKNSGITLFNCTNIIYATGGPAGIYKTSVYPESQHGSSGIAFEAGVRGSNLTESQYGIASIKFRWNLSGTYQQVLPRYVSTDIHGNDEKEFLQEHFASSSKMLNAIFLKGYQWPFDPSKIANYGSSLIDILVYKEIIVKGRRVFLDYTKNPSLGSDEEEFDFSILGGEAYKYLENCSALFGTPIERLNKINRPAIDLYKNNGIDLYSEHLEIAVCAQHNNGGLLGDIWWQSNLKHFFPVGEVNGTFGVYRPGGTALNSTQVGSLRAAQYIVNCYSEVPMTIDNFKVLSKDKIESKLETINKSLTRNDDKTSNLNILTICETAQKRMSECGAHIRSLEKCKKALKCTIEDLALLEKDITITSYYELPEYFKTRDILITQIVYLSSIIEYIEHGGKSRGSYLISNIEKQIKYELDNGALYNKICEVELGHDSFTYCNFSWKKVRPIPKEDEWFETVWKIYRENKMEV